MPSIAPLAAAWQRRLGGKPGPFSAPAGSGESPNGSPIQVELFVAGAWTDITSYVMTRDGSQQIDISRGISAESSRMDPARCTLQLNNRDGRFSPRNPLSPYYGAFGRNQPLRVSVPSGNGKSYRFWGEVSSWPQGWDPSGNDVWVDVEAAGLFRRLSQGNSPLKSAIFREFTKPSRSGIVGYWPMEDSPSSTSLASGIGGTPMTISGTPTLYSYSGWPASDSLPIIGDASLAGRIPAYPDTGELSIRAFIVPPSSGVGVDQTIISLNTTGSASLWVVTLTTSGGLGISAYSSTGATLMASGVGAFGINGKRSLVTVDLRQIGPDIYWALGVQDIETSTIGLTNGSSLPGALASNTFGVANSITFGGGGSLANTAMGHAVVSSDTEAFDSTSQAIVAWAGENPSLRLLRICSEELIPFSSITDGLMGNPVFMGAQKIGTLQDLILQCIDTDLQIQFEPTDGIGVATRSRLSLYNQVPALTLSYADNALSGVPTPIDDDRYTRNQVSVARIDGSSVVLEQTTGPLSTANAPAGVGRYDTSYSISAASDNDLVNHAGWRLHMGTVDEARYPQISVNLAHPTFTANPSLRNQVLGVRPGDRITITNPPPWLPPDPISQIVLGFSESIDNFQHRVTFNCAPESPYHVLVLDDTMYGRIDGGSQLAQPVGPTATTLTVASTDGSLWTTNPADLPLDWMVGGEQVTVTAVSGAVSPQTATVIRSVNGIVKAQAAGTTIQLYQPAVLAL